MAVFFNLVISRGNRVCLRHMGVPPCCTADNPFRMTRPAQTSAPIDAQPSAPCNGRIGATCAKLPSARSQPRLCGTCPPPPPAYTGSSLSWALTLHVGNFPARSCRRWLRLGRGRADGHPQQRGSGRNIRLCQAELLALAETELTTLEDAAVGSWETTVELEAQLRARVTSEHPWEAARCRGQAGAFIYWIYIYVNGVRAPKIRQERLGWSLPTETNVYGKYTQRRSRVMPSRRNRQYGAAPLELLLEHTQPRPSQRPKYSF